MFRHSWIALRPRTDWILTVEHELNGLVERGPVFRIALFYIQPQKELGGFGRSRVVERGIAPIMLKLFEAPAIFSDRVVPLA
jgi:hypothetical protein